MIITRDGKEVGKIGLVMKGPVPHCYICKKNDPLMYQIFWKNGKRSKTAVCHNHLFR